MSTGALSELLQAAAVTRPTAIAVAEKQRSIDYAQLWAGSCCFANALRARGIGIDHRVAVLLPNRLEAVIACYGTWLAGATVVPLNVQARARDYLAWLEHAQPSLIVHESDNAELWRTLHELASPIARIALGESSDSDNSWSAIVDAQSASMKIVPTALDQVAQILYTSGTTGDPKGVMLSHANLASNVRSVVDYLQLTGADSIVSVLPFYYSYGSSVLHTHLSVGGRVCLEDNLVYPHLVVQRIANERVSGFSGVPSTFALLLERGELASQDLHALRYVTQAGGPMTPAVTSRLRAALPRARIFVMYGQTEATARRPARASTSC